MMDINDIKARISELYENNVEIHICVHSKKPKINIEDATAKITGIYKNLFTLEVIENGLKKVYSVQYTDLFIGKMKIKEMQKQSE